MDIKAIGNEFKAFILKGNVVDLAVGVVIGAAFGKVVEAVVGSIINPMIALANHLPGIAIKVADQKGFGDFVNAVLTFMVVAAVVFFLIVKPMNLLVAMTKRQAEERPSDPPPMPEDVKLLMEIRDLLKAQKQAGQI
jgi:large conductance mechanosensitive channel